MQIHDELVYDCPAHSDTVTVLRDVLRTAMETTISQLLPLRVPLTVNMAVGKTLGSLRPIPLADPTDPQQPA
jgi:DNA polymerase I-like protein with 3'-5' exonuclease and polymerase domains